jgi:HAE1 family hydrophobic/amphiphilic exporter-1
MTSQVVLPLEAALNTISGLDTISAQTQEGNARINCTFILERDIEGAAQDVREKVAGALRNLPPNILPPVITKSDPDSDPILTMIVSGDNGLRETTEIADKQIKRILETVDGVGAVNITGARLREIRVFADAEKLNAYNITISQLQKAIQSENIETPAGDMVAATLTSACGLSDESMPSVNSATLSLPVTAHRSA